MACLPWRVSVEGYPGHGKFKSSCLMKCRNMFKYRIRLLVKQQSGDQKAKRVTLKRSGEPRGLRGLND